MLLPNKNHSSKLVFLSMVEHFFYCDKNIATHFCFWNSNWDIHNFFFSPNIVVVSNVISIDNLLNRQW